MCGLNNANAEIVKAQINDLIGQVNEEYDRAESILELVIMECALGMGVEELRDEVVNSAKASKPAPTEAFRSAFGRKTRDFVRTVFTISEEVRLGFDTTDPEVPMLVEAYWNNLRARDAKYGVSYRLAYEKVFRSILNNWNAMMDGWGIPDRGKGGGLA